MRSNEAREAGRLATGVVTDAVSHVEQVHDAIASRAFSLTAPVSSPVRVLHDTVAGAVYGTVRVASLAAGVAVSKCVGAVAGGSSPAGSTARGNTALAVLNAARGDQLARQGSPLAIRMALRRDREDVVVRRRALRAAFPRATSMLAVFVHGLAETEESWSMFARRADGDSSTYGDRFAHDFGYTPVYLRYNTGLHISENGAQLSALLEETVSAWPVPVDEVLLVGHSVGGLVARSACHVAQLRGEAWVSLVRHVFYLGSPHLGAGLEQWVERLSEMLAKLEESRPLASVLDRRSAGIKDLRTGHLLDDDWRGATSSLEPHGSDVPLLPWANHYAVSAAVMRSRRNPLGRLVGDLLVQPASAQGRSANGRHIPFRDEHQRHFGGLHHFNLLNDASVYEAMHDWLDPAAARRSEIAGTASS